MILAGRRINDGMGSYVAQRVVKLMTQRDVQVASGPNMLVLGLTFKENCPDLRNTRVVDIVRSCEASTPTSHVHDPWVDADEARHEYGLELIEQLELGKYDAIVLAVSHREFVALGADGIRALRQAGLRSCSTSSSALPRDRASTIGL